MSDPTAFVRKIDGQLYLDDPVAEGVIVAVESANRRKLLEVLTHPDNMKRVNHFARRIEELGRDPNEVVIVILNVNDEHGAVLTDILMPGNQSLWQDIRKRGMTPFARGLAERGGIQMFLRTFDEVAANRLERIDGAAVVVVDFGVARAWSVEALRNMPGHP